MHMHRDTTQANITRMFTQPLSNSSHTDRTAPVIHYHGLSHQEHTAMPCTSTPQIAPCPSPVNALPTINVAANPRPNAHDGGAQMPDTITDLQGIVVMKHTKGQHVLQTGGDLARTRTCPERTTHQSTTAQSTHSTDSQPAAETCETNQSGGIVEPNVLQIQGDLAVLEPDTRTCGERTGDDCYRKKSFVLLPGRTQNCRISLRWWKMYFISQGLKLFSELNFHSKSKSRRNSKVFKNRQSFKCSFQPMRDFTTSCTKPLLKIHSATAIPTAFPTP